MPETLDVTDMIPTTWEHKTRHRWLISIDGIDSFLLKGSPKIPEAPFSKEPKIELKAYDAIVPAGAQHFMKMLQASHDNGGTKDFPGATIQFKMLDPVGTVARLVQVEGFDLEWNDVDYYSTKLSDIVLKIKEKHYGSTIDATVIPYSIMEAI